MHHAPRSVQPKNKHYRLTPPIWVFLTIIFMVLFITFVGLQPSAQPKANAQGNRIIPVGGSDIQKLIGVPGVALAGQCGYCGWYSLCNNNTYWCCTQWIQTGCGGDPQSASVTGTVTCDQWGAYDWCKSNARLVLTVSNPQNETITVSGTAGSVPISCTSSCTIDLPQGTGTATYTMTASPSNTTSSGSTTWGYDPELPTAGVNLSGTSGADGWYISPVTVAAAATDAISGPAGASISVDGGAEQSSATLTEGIHSVIASAIDNAGNTALATAVDIKVDTTTPTINTSIAGAPGANSWYISDVQISATASDATSGINTIESTVDGGSWTVYSAPITISDGVHHIQFRTTDNAGNVTTTADQTIQVDTTAPLLTPTVSGTSGSGGWYTSDAQVSVTGSDSESGIASVQVSVDGGAWTAYTAPLNFTSGKHTLQFQATDNAGNSSQVTQSVAVDTNKPAVDLPKSWILGRIITYTVTDGESGLGALRVVIEDEKEHFKKVVIYEDVSGASFEGEINWDGKFADGTVAPPGDYQVWVKTSDNAGNETFQLGMVTVEASIFNWFVLPTKTPTATPAATPTATLQPTATAQPTATQQVSAPAKPMIVVSSGVSGGTGNAQKAPDPIQTNLPTVATAVAAMAAYAAYEQQKKREEELAKQAAEEERREKGRAEARARAEAEWDRASAQLAANTRRVAQAEMTQAEKLAAYQATNQYKSNVASTQAWEQQKKNEAKAALADMTPAEKMAAYQQTEQYKNYQASLQTYEQQKANEDFRKGERAPENVTVPQKSWLENAWDNTKNFVQQKIIQPVQQIAKPILDNPTIRKTAIQTVVTAVTITGLATTYQWYQNVANQPNLFDALKQNAKARYVQLGNQYPDLKADPKQKLENLLTKPYQALNAGFATLNAITDTATEYADAVWQQNPHVQQFVNQLTSLDASTCSKIANHALTNGCTGAFYLAASLGEKPFDTGLGIANAFVVDPIAGLVKIAALNVEHPAIPELIQNIQKDGLSGVGNFLSERWNLTKNIISTDGQVSSALMLLGLLGAAIIAPPVAGGIVLGITGKSLIDIGAAVAQASDRLQVIRYVTSRQVRTTVVSSAIILGLMGLGTANKVSEFNSFQEGLSPSAQASLQELSLLEQTRLADLASQMKLPSNAVDFYLEHAGDARLVDIPLADALHVSALAEQTGKGALLMDYVARYGYTDALQIASPEVIKGMTNNQFLVQAQDILSNDAGYNVTPEDVFISHPGSTIGKTSTFITNEATISDIIGDFHGTKIIYVSQDQAISLANALGLKPVSLVDGFRISKISNLGSLGLSYPLEGTPPLFRGPGQGLPGGGTEITVNPPILMDSPNVVDQIIIKVYP